MSLIRVEGLNFAFPGRPPLWHNLSFTLQPGQRIGLWGPNGCGKSTLFNLIMGLLLPQSGQIWLNDRPCRQESDFASQRTSFGYAFQDPEDQLFCASVLEDVAFGPLNQGHKHAEARRLSSEALATFGLAGYEDRTTYHLSNGEKRLVSLAAVWAMRPKTLLLDEPRTFLDVHAQVMLREVLLASKFSWIMISHNRDFLRATCQEIWGVQHGGLVSLPG